MLAVWRLWKLDRLNLATAAAFQELLQIGFFCRLWHAANKERNGLGVLAGLCCRWCSSCAAFVLYLHRGFEGVVVRLKPQNVLVEPSTATAKKCEAGCKEIKVSYPRLGVPKQGIRETIETSHTVPVALSLCTLRVSERKNLCNYTHKMVND